MKRVYFVFKDMKEAEYYWRELSYILKNTAPYVESTRGPFRIFTYVKKEKQKENNFMKKIFKILIQLKIVQKEYVDIPTEIIFKSKKSALRGIKEPIYYFKEDYYDDSYLLKFLKEKV